MSAGDTRTAHEDAEVERVDPEKIARYPAVKGSTARMNTDDRTVVIDFRVDPAEKCYPMVPAGASNDDIILGPEFEKEHADVLHDTPEAII